MRGPEITSDGRLLGGVLLAFCLVAGLAGLDLFADVREGAAAGHLAIEAGLTVVGLCGSLVIARGLLLVVRQGRAARDEARVLAERLQATQAEAERWRAEARALLQGLGAALEQQFERWALSEAEKEVALLLLKGLSHKEIAAARSVTEATARQQAGAVYRKAGLGGRNDLSAFFLEDLLLPAASRPTG